MNRRTFVLGSLSTIGVLTACRRKSASKAGRLIRKLDRARRAVGTLQPGGRISVDIPDVTGWDLELEEDDNVVWDLVATNTGHNRIRAVYCQPGTFGPWQIADRLLVPVGSQAGLIKRWRACNEDHFFFVEMETGNNVWETMDGEPGNSDANLGGDNTIAHMSWNRPQYVALQVQWARGQHMTCE